MGEQNSTALLLTKEAVCARLGISPRTLENSVRANEFPPPVRLGKRTYWSEKALEAWMRRLLSAQEAWSPLRSPR
jgi:prophage regulatory protein